MVGMTANIHRLKYESDASFFQLGVTHGVAAAYGVASIGTVVFIITPQILLLYFLTAVLHVPPAWAGVAMLVPKCLEVVLDPCVGAFSDRTSSSMGRRLPFMLIGAAIFPLAFAGLFAPPDFAQWPLALVWVTAVYSLSTAAFSVFAVPYITIAGEMAQSPSARMRIVSWRMGFVAIGVLVAGAGAPLSREQQKKLEALGYVE